MPDELPAWVDVLDEFDLGMRLHGDRVEAAELAHLHEGGLQLRQRLHGGRRPMCSSFARMVIPLTSFTRIHRARETAFVPSLGGALLALHRIFIALRPREPVLRRGSGRPENPLRHEIGLERDRRIDRPGAAGGADADPTHDSMPPADLCMSCCPHDFARRQNSPHRGRTRRSG